MKFLGYAFVALALVAGGIVIVKTGLWDAFVNWVTSWVH